MEKLTWKYRKCEGLEAGTGLVLEGQGGSQCGWDRDGGQEKCGNRS